MSDGRHLFIIVHGLLGNPSHVKFISDTLSKRVDNTDTFLPEANAGFLTFDGIEVCAQRLLLEIEAFLEGQEVDGVVYTKISFVGYSLGGLFGRYLLGLMDDKGLFEKYEPFSFTTFATPHAGSYFHKQAARSGILNFFGANVLGIAGNDLFANKSTVLVDMSDPKGKFYQALKKFKHIILFANTLHDRTVPFFTGYISNKDPFRHRDYLDTVLSPLEAGRDGKNFDQALVDGQPPMFLDMAESKYLDVSATGEDAKPTTEEKVANIVFMFLIPMIFPILVGVTSTMTIISNNRASEFKKLLASGDTAELLKRLKKTKKLAIDGKNDGTKRHHHGENVAEVAVDALDDILPETDDKHAHHSQPSARSLAEGEFHPKPLIGDGYKGLIDSTPHKLELPDSINTVIDNLNTLPWEKYAVRVHRMHSHAEIINRRDKPGQGTMIVGFWAELVASKIAAATDVKRDN